ncbi:prepilin peptidase [Haloferula helveola]|uniref:Prepilin peptidase n=1 Tax=Haloferula helveola TaxID=490095 RepID=A0ABM7REA3_9BACT|nr:prepilin peptidase [Haloferula helveola]
MRFTGGVIYPPLDHPLWLVIAFLVGSCIGSFLNVVIYRLPLGLSVNDPKRSFCPNCKKEIPLRLNVPLISWLWLRGRCKECKTPISVRYFVVELLTGILFVAGYWVLIGHVSTTQFEIGLLALIPIWFMLAAFVAIVFIDAEHMIIPLELTVSGTVAGFLTAALLPVMPDLVAWNSPDPTWKGGLWQSLLGFILGYFGLWAIVLLGKLAFGRFELKHDEPVDWRLEEPKGDEDPILFHMGEESIEWWDIFFRKTDRLIIEAQSLEVDGEKTDPGLVTISELTVTLPDGKVIQIEELKALSGTSSKAVVPREAMGMGDVHLMGVIGAFFGPIGVFFSLMASSLFAILAAVLGRIGFGVRLPFGPFLVLGALAWFFGGWKLAVLYLDFMR